MCDNNTYYDSDLNISGRLTRINTSMVAMDICNSILAEPQVIGVKIVGRDLGTDNGKIYLIAFAKCDGDAFIFDLKLNPAIMKNGHLKHVLETVTVIKVMHGARLGCLTVCKEFHFQIQNVFDTEIAHTIIEAQIKGCSPFQVELPSITRISDIYGYGLKNKYRDRITACLKKNKNFFGHRPLSKPTAEFVATEAALLVPFVFSNMDQMINPCNKGLFNKLCSIRICAHFEPEPKPNKAKNTTSNYIAKKIKGKLKAPPCSLACKNATQPTCRSKNPPSPQPKKKSGSCPNSPVCLSPRIKRKKPCSCKYSPKKEKKLPCTCSRGIQTNIPSLCPSPDPSTCPTSGTTYSPYYMYPPPESCQPQPMERIRCYGHTEDVPTSWQLVQIAGMEVDDGYQKTTQSDCPSENNNQSEIQCSCCEVACNTEKPSSSRINKCNHTTEGYTEFESDSEVMTSECDEIDSDGECYSEEEKYDLC